MRFDKQWYFLAVLAAVVVLALRLPTVLQYQSLKSGTETVTGRIDDIQASRRVRVIRYSYEVAGKTYHGEDTSRDRFLKGVPVQVTYAPANPSVGTIQPEQVGSKYVVSLVVCIVAVLPLVIMLLLELKRKPSQPVQESASNDPPAP